VAARAAHQELAQHYAALIGSMCGQPSEIAAALRAA
jgi:hypothetical protein